MNECIKGNGGERTRLAIKKYRAMEAWANGSLSDDGYFRVVNDVYNKKMQLGCPKCGAVKRFGVGLCRRCYRLRPALRDASVALSPQGFIYQRQQEFALFAKSLINRPISPAAKLDALLIWKPAN